MYKTLNDEGYVVSQKLKENNRKKNEENNGTRNIKSRKKIVA